VHDRKFEGFDLSDKLDAVVKDVMEHDAVMRVLGAKLDDKDVVVSAEMKILLLRSEAIETSIGRRIHMDSTMLDVPTLWGSVAMLAGFVQEIQTSLQDLPDSTAIKREFELKIKSFERKTVEIVNTTASNMGARTDAVNSKLEALEVSTVSGEQNILSLGRAASKLKEDLRVVRAVVLSLKDNSQVGNVQARQSFGINLDIQIALEAMEGRIENGDHELLKTIEELTKRVDSVVAESDGDAVKFFSLGLRNHVEGEQWVLANLGTCSYGLVVDAQLVMEHVYSQVSENEGTIKICKDYINSRSTTLHKV
jgi:hypothetical protein